MDRIAVVFGFQWLAYWRRLRRTGRINTGNAGLLALLGGIGVFKYLQQLPAIANQLAQSHTTKYVTILTVVFLGWLLPVMAESRRSITSRALLHFPFTAAELYLVRLGSVFVSPVTWIIVVCSLALSYPLAAAPNLGGGLGALLLFLIFSLALSLTIADLPRSGKLLNTAAGIAAAAAAYLALRGRASAAGLTFWPHQLAANISVSSQPVRSFALLTGLTVTAYAFSFWIFGRSLQPPPDRRSQRFTVSGLIEFPGRFGGLLKKDFRDLSRLLDFHIAVTIAGLFSLYLIFTAAPSSSSFWIIIVVLFLPACSAAFNCFGLDTPLGLDRYMLLPLTGRDILLSKNLAFALVNIVLFSIMLPFVFWRFGAGVSALGAVEMVVVGLAYLSWGNWMSIKHPFQMQYYRLSSGGSPVDAVLGIIFGSLPGAVAAYLLHEKKYGALWSILATMMFYFALYYVSLSWSGRRLEKHREALRSAIS